MFVSLNHHSFEMNIDPATPKEEEEPKTKSDMVGTT